MRARQAKGCNSAQQSVQAMRDELDNRRHEQHLLSAKVAELQAALDEARQARAEEHASTSLDLERVSSLQEARQSLSECREKLSKLDATRRAHGSSLPAESRLQAANASSEEAQNLHAQEVKPCSMSSRWRKIWECTIMKRHSGSRDEDGGRKKARALMRDIDSIKREAASGRENSRLEASMMSDQLHAESIHAEATRIASEHIDEDLSASRRREAQAQAKVRSLAQELRKRVPSCPKSAQTAIESRLHSKPCGSDMRNLLL